LICTNNLSLVIFQVSYLLLPTHGVVGLGGEIFRGLAKSYGNSANQKAVKVNVNLPLQPVRNFNSTCTMARGKFKGKPKRGGIPEIKINSLRIGGKSFSRNLAPLGPDGEEADVQSQTPDQWEVAPQFT
jgi:hypothetical protein